MATTAAADILARFVALEEMTDAVREDLARAADAYVAAAAKQYQPRGASLKVDQAPVPPPPPTPRVYDGVVVEVTTHEVEEFAGWMDTCRERALEDLVTRGLDTSETSAPRGGSWTLRYARNLARFGAVPDLARVLDVLRGAYALARVEKRAGADEEVATATAEEVVEHRSKFRAAAGAGEKQQGRRLCLLTQEELEDEEGVELVPAARFESLFSAELRDDDAPAPSTDSRYRFSVVASHVALVDALFWIVALPKRAALCLADPAGIDVPTVVAAYQHAVAACETYVHSLRGKRASKRVE
jgi:hypothetical protein